MRKSVESQFLFSDSIMVALSIPLVWKCIRWTIFMFWWPVCFSSRDLNPVGYSCEVFSNSGSTGQRSRRAEAAFASWLGSMQWTIQLSYQQHAVASSFQVLCRGCANVHGGHFEHLQPWICRQPVSWYVSFSAQDLSLFQIFSSLVPPFTTDWLLGKWIGTSIRSLALFTW